MNIDEYANPDLVWNRLSLAAKRAWVETMQPDPDAGYLPPDDGGDPYRSVFGPIEFIPDMTDPPIPGVLCEAIVRRYVELVRGNTTPEYNATAAVLAAIGRANSNCFDGTADPWEIVMELSDTAHELGIVGPDYDNDPDGVDAFNDQLAGLLPAVKEALS